MSVLTSKIRAAQVEAAESVVTDSLQAKGLIDTPPAFGAWQSIESAPVNTSVLIWIPNAEHYGPPIYRGLQVDMGTGRHWTVSGLHMGRDCGDTWQPTLWMPLPDPPKE